MDIDEEIAIEATNGNKKRVKELISRGADINWAVYGYAKGGYEKRVEELLQTGADINWAIYGYEKGQHAELFNELKNRRGIENRKVLKMKTNKKKFAKYGAKAFALFCMLCIISVVGGKEFFEFLACFVAFKGCTYIIDSEFLEEKNKIKGYIDNFLGK